MNIGIDISDIQHWVEEQMIRGRYMFTKQDVLDLGLPIKEVRRIRGQVPDPL